MLRSPPPGNGELANGKASRNKECMELEGCGEMGYDALDAGGGADDG